MTSACVYEIFFRASAVLEPSKALGATSGTPRSRNRSSNIFGGNTFDKDNYGGKMLEVIALNTEDARAAKEGGAGRVELVGSMEFAGISPIPELVSEIAWKVGIPVRPMLRLEDGFGTDRLEELQALASQFVEAGADGIVLGFLRGGKIDVETTNEILGRIQGKIPYTFHRAIDEVTDYLAAWKSLDELIFPPDQVLTSGGAPTAGDPEGYFRELVERRPEAREVILAGGGLSLEGIPRLKALGIKNFHVGSGVRPEESFDNPVSAELVASWVEAVERD